jgi:ketosteroid isomerase-like protein
MAPDRELEAFIARYGDALSAGDVATIAASWDIPALVVSDEGAIAVSTAAEIEGFFRQAIQWYRAEGLVSTRGEIVHTEPMSPRLITADVRWPAYDATGAERHAERTRYLLRLDDQGELRIRVAVTLPPG